MFVYNVLMDLLILHNVNVKKVFNIEIKGYYESDTH